MTKQDKVEKVMHEWKTGTLTSNGKQVTDYDQAVAIALSEAGLSKYADGGGVGLDNFYVKSNFGNFSVTDRRSNKMVVGYSKKEDAIITAKGLNDIDNSKELNETISKLKTMKGYGHFLNKYADGGGVGLDNFDALDLPISYKLINNKGEVIFKTNSFNKASDTRTIKGFEGEGKLKIIATDKSGNQKIIADGIDEDGKKYEKGGNMNKYAKGGAVDAPKIYVADLEAYNNGKLVGEWLDLSDFKDGKDVSREISKLLKKWGAEEYAIHDVENVPSSIYSEYMGEEDFDKIIKIYKASEENDLPYEVISEIILQYEPKDLEEWISDHYEGHFDNDTDLAYSVVENMGGVSDLGKKTTEMYFDYEGFGRDLEINDEWEGDFDSDEDRAYDYVENMGGVSELGDKTIDMYFDYEKFGRDLAINDYTEIEDGYYFRTPRYAKGGTTNKRKFAVGGEIGNTVSFKGDYGTPRSGVIKEKRGGSYIVGTDDGDRLVDSYEVIGFSETPIAKKKRFGFFAEGGEILGKIYEREADNLPIAIEYKQKEIRKSYPEQATYIEYGSDSKGEYAVVKAKGKAKFAGGGEVDTVSFNRVKSNFKNNLEIFNGEVVTIGDDKFKIEGNKFYIKRPNEGWTIFRIIKGEMFAGGGEIENKIEKLKKVVSSKMLPESVKAKAQAEIDKLEKELHESKETKAEEKEEHEAGNLTQKEEKRLNELQAKEDNDNLNKTENSEYEKLVVKYRKAKENKMTGESEGERKAGMDKEARLDEKEELNATIQKLYGIESKAEDLINYQSGGIQGQSVDKIKKYVEYVNKEVSKLDVPFGSEVFEVLEDENAHSLNLTLGLLGFYKNKRDSGEWAKEYEQYAKVIEVVNEVKGGGKPEAKKPKFKIGDVVGLDLDERTPKMITSFKTNRKGEIIYSGYYIPFPDQKWNYEESEIVLLKTPSKPEAKAETKERDETEFNKLKEKISDICHDKLGIGITSSNLSTATNTEYTFEPKTKDSKYDGMMLSYDGNEFEVFEFGMATNTNKDTFKVFGRYKNLQAAITSLSKGNTENRNKTTRKAPVKKAVAKKVEVKKEVEAPAKPKADHKKLVAKLKAKKGGKEYDNRASVNVKTGERYKRSESSDKKREAKPLGKRVSADGSVYYENRLNRADMNKEDKFEDGGEVKGSDWGLNLNW